MFSGSFGVQSIVLCKCSGKYIDIYFKLKITCSANSVQDGDRSLRAPVRPRGGFPSFHGSEDAYFQIPVHQLSRKLLRVLS